MEYGEGIGEGGEEGGRRDEGGVGEVDATLGGREAKLVISGGCGRGRDEEIGGDAKGGGEGGEDVAMKSSGEGERFGGGEGEDGEVGHGKEAEDKTEDRGGAAGDGEDETA